MKKYQIIIISGIFSLSTTVSADLFFSEYIEGSAYNKALEIYNPSSETIDLSGYSIQLFSNGRSSANSTFHFSGKIEAYGVYIVANPKAGYEILNIANKTSKTVNFNGNDAVTLTKNGIIIDVIGQLGFNPGSKWGAKNLSTKDCTLRRKNMIVTGVPRSNYPFDPSIEWEGFAKDDFSGLGQF